MHKIYKKIQSLKKCSLVFDLKYIKKIKPTQLID